ncbi:hypothetical protein [Streptomyces sp. BH104]|uniref:hypothetical protein n=1 Tax=Streptomyces sp. BH104 TaxID=3410407 RepID=UPI003BB72786
MATFDQRGQQVNKQIQGEYVMVAAGDTTIQTISAEALASLERLCADASAEEYGEAGRQVAGFAQQALHVASSGDRAGVRTWLQRAFDAATPVAALAASVATVLQLF